MAITVVGWDPVITPGVDAAASEFPVQAVAALVVEEEALEDHEVILVLGSLQISKHSARQWVNGARTLAR